MQWSELVAGAGLCVFFIIIVGIAAMFYWKRTKLEHEERRSMIEKGMTPTPRFGGGWPSARQHENQLRFEERRLMIEKGMMPPDPDRWQRDDFLRRGLVMFFLGIGLGISYYLLPASGDAHWYLGFLSPGLALVGLGCLTYYALSAKTSAEGAQR
ncbi:MAG TPA: hypothetical protein VH436_23495 [Vicinamibacterales bacterium]|jgi:hypothetical protein